MKILDRYVLREMAGPILLGIGLYTFVLFMNEMFLVARLAFQQNLPLVTLGEILALQLPRILLLTIPMGLLLGVLIALGRMSGDGEITALRAAGISYLRLGRSVLTAGAAGCLIGLVLYNFLAPGVHAREDRLRREQGAQADLNEEIRPGVFYDAIPGFVLFAGQVASDDAEWPLRSIFARLDPVDGPEEILVARKGRLSRDVATGTILFSADDGELHLFDPARPESYRVSRFVSPYQQSFLPEAGPRTPGPGKVEVRNLSTPELNQFLQQRREKRVGGKNEAPEASTAFRRGWLERDKRFAIPLASVAFALLGLPLGLVTGRGGRAAGFALSIPVILLFWMTFTLCSDLAENGKIPLWAGAWTADAIVFALAAVLLLFRQRIEVFSVPEWIVGPLRAIASRLPGLRAGVAAGAAAREQDETAAEERAARRSGSARVFRLGLFDRYIGGLFLRSFVLVLLSVYTIVWVVLARSTLESLTVEHLPPSVLGSYLLYASPGAAWYIVPISAVVAALVAVGLIERGNEGVAMRAAGVSVYRMAVPVLLGTSVVCAGVHFVQERVAPVSNAAALRIEDQLEGRTGTVRPGVRWLFGRGGRLYGYAIYDVEPSGFQGLTVLELSPRWDGVRRRLWADRAQWDGAGWKVQSGWQWNWTSGEIASWDSIAGESLRALDGPSYFNSREESFLKGSRLPEQMTLAELREHLKATRRSGYDATELRVAYAARTALPFTPLVMVLLGLPFGFRMGRRGSLYGVGVSLALVMVYWGLFAAFNALGLEGVVTPFLSAWAPNLLFGMAGAWLLLSVRS